MITVRFRSLVPNGVLLYAADDLQNPSHFISLELVNGRLVFKYNAGYMTVKVMSTLSSYADGGHEYTVQPFCIILPFYRLSQLSAWIFLIWQINY